MKMASSSIATVQLSSSVEPQVNSFRQEFKHEINSSSSSISPNPTSFQEVLGPWFELTPIHPQVSTFSSDQFQPFPRSLIPSDPIRLAGHSLQSITNTTPGLYSMIKSKITFNKSFNLNSPVYNPNQTQTYHTSSSSPVYNPNPSTILNEFFSNHSPVYNPNANSIFNELFSNHSPVYNPNSSRSYHELFSNNSPIYNPNSSEMFNISSSKNEVDRQIDNQTSSPEVYSQSSFQSTDLMTDPQESNQPDLNLNPMKEDNQAFFKGYDQWETIILTSDLNPSLILPYSNLSKSHKRSRSLDPYSSFDSLNSTQPNSNLDLDLELGSDPGPSKRFKIST
ncbi:hypothetical protein DFH28DRAFT_952027 [Melampsora americana]|nr:hypothetical protein DFH28DRAFT_952027 [Melampsora americana]